MGESRLGQLDTDTLFRLGEIDEQFDLSESQWQTVREAYKAVMELISSGQETYGIHTHYGHNVATRVDWQDYQRHQRRLLDYLHVGVGPSLAASTVRRALRLQCLKVAEGRSGVHPAVLEAVVELSNGRCSHTVPSWGSLGASGDLIPMAHAIAPAVKRVGIHGPRDVIGMVNTNATMASLAVENFVAVRDLVERAHEITALVSVALRATREHFTAELFGRSNARQENAQRSAEKILSYHDRFLSREGAQASQSPGPAVLQERYSVRCAPMILGNNLDVMEFAEKKILMEALAVADNPVLSEGDEGDGGGGGPRFLHGGLFYAASLATAADAMQDTLLKTGEMLDRQVLLLMDGAWSHGLPNNLALSGAGAGGPAGGGNAGDGGAGAGERGAAAPAAAAGADHLKGIHQLLSALRQKLKASATRSHELSFSSEQHNQDVLPAAMTAQLQLQASISVARELTRGALFCAKRASLLRLGQAIPSELALAAWPDFVMEAAAGAAHPDHAARAADSNDM
ncbi:MAG: aromatic amino acid lyase [Spirochaetia bacterium]